jgi:ribokinase
MHSLRINRSPEIVIVGSANEDLVVRAARLPRPGETVLGGGLREFFGGKGANQAVAAHRAGGGLGVAFVGKLGSDGRGDKYADHLEAEGLDVSMLGRAKDSPTGVALIVVGPDGENLITVAPGANAHLSPADIEKAKDAIRGARVVLAQLEVPLETVEAAFRIAARAGVRTLLNPAPAPEKLPKGLLARTDVIIPNRSEAEALTGVAIPSVEAAGAACAALRDAGAGSVVTTLGEEGAVFSGPEGAGHLRPPGVDAADTTGAGDAFCGALAACLAEGRSLSDAVRFACAAGALACTVRGAQPSLPAGDRIESLAARMG